jgi:hypothetical protein
MARWVACLWAILFAMVHVFWLAGGRAGLPSDIDVVPGSALFFAAVAAIPILTIAGCAAVLTRKSSSDWTHRITVVVVGLTTVFCMTHALPPLLAHAWLALTGADRALDERAFYMLAIYEPNWLFGGVAFATVLSSCIRLRMTAAARRRRDRCTRPNQQA